MADRDAMRLMRAARQDDVDAQVALAQLYLNGEHGLPKDPKAAYVWLLRAAESGSSQARQLLCERIPAARIDAPQRVLSWFQLAARRGSTNACKVLAEWMLSGLVPGAGPEQAIALIEQVAQRGDVGSQLKAAHWWDSREGDPTGMARATTWFERAAAAGSVAAQQALVERLWPQSPASARPWLEQLAGKGDLAACARLGAFLLANDQARAAAPLLERAAQAGHLDAAYHLGQLYATSKGRRETGRPHSYKRAAAWWDRAARAGHIEAAFSLYRLYSNRSFSLRDPVAAHAYLQAAAERGHAEAQYLCGLSARRQRVTAEAEVTAAAWFIRAAEQGHALARDELDALCQTAPFVQPDLACKRTDLLREIARTDLCLAARLEVGCAFGLSVREALDLDLANADRTHCLIVVGRGTRRSRPTWRLYRVRPGEERQLLDRASAVLALESRPGAHLAPWKARLAQLRQVLGANVSALGLLEPQPASADAPTIAPGLSE